MYKLDNTLENDSIFIAHLALCELRIIKKSSIPWLLLIPKKADVTEVHQLSQEDQVELIREISTLSKFLTARFNPDKINIGALGNMVPQLHIHVICRYRDDPSWPSPIWGKQMSFDENKTKETINTVLSNFLLIPKKD